MEHVARNPDADGAGGAVWHPRIEANEARRTGNATGAEVALEARSRRRRQQGGTDAGRVPRVIRRQGTPAGSARHQRQRDGGRRGLRDQERRDARRFSCVSGTSADADVATERHATRHSTACDAANVVDRTRRSSGAANGELRPTRGERGAPRAGRGVEDDAPADSAEVSEWANGRGSVTPTHDPPPASRGLSFAPHGCALSPRNPPRSPRPVRRTARFVRRASVAVPRSRTPYTGEFDSPRSQHHKPQCVLCRFAQSQHPRQRMCQKHS